MKRIAFLGSGAMGSRMVQNLLNAQHQVTVYNRTQEKVMPLVNQGAVYAATPRQAVEQAEIVMSMVTDDQVSRLVWLDPETGAALGLEKNAIAIESSTLTIDWVKELGAALQRRGIAFLDAPVVGSRPQAEAGKLTYLVGGNAETLAGVRSVLVSAGAANVFSMGDVGQGTAMKLAVNALFGIQVAALAEVMGTLDKQGISPTKAMECLGELPIISPAAKLASSLMLTNNHAPLFPIALVAKDFRYMVQSAQAAGAEAPISIAIGDIYQNAIAKGYGEDNVTGIIQLFT